jgi:hypothetical protein
VNICPQLDSRLVSGFGIPISKAGPPVRVSGFGLLLRQISCGFGFGVSGLEMRVQIRGHIR